MLKSIIKKPLILTILFLSLTLLIITLFSIFKKPTKKIEILVAPVSATITINNKNYTNGTYNFPLGELTATIEKSGFTTKNITIDTNNTNKLYAFIVQEDGSFSWYEDHPDDALILNTIGAEESNITSASYKEKYPIMSILPIIVAEYDKEYNYTEYRIDGGSFNDCPKDFCLKITDITGNNYEPALAKIKNLNFNPENYQILYEYTPIIPLN